MPPAEKPFRLVEITPGGVTGYYGPAARTQGTHRCLDEFLARMEPDGVVLDSRDPIDRQFALVLRSPYPEPYLDRGVITNAHGLPRNALAGVARGFWGADAEIMLDSSPAFPFTGFDTVSLDLYVAYWWAHGARVGRRGSDGELVWTNVGA